MDFAYDPIKEYTFLNNYFLMLPFQFCIVYNKVLVCKIKTGMPFLAFYSLEDVGTQIQPHG